MTTEVLERPTINHPGKVLNSIHKEQIINELVKEIPQREIASQFGVTQGRIHQIKKESEERIELKQQEIIEELPSIVDTIKSDVATNKKLSDNLNKSYCYATTELLKLKDTLDKTNVNVLKVAGILRPQALLNFQQFNQDNRQINIEPSIMGLFGGGFSDSMQVIDMKEDSNDGDNDDNVDSP